MNNCSSIHNYSIEKENRQITILLSPAIFSYLPIPGNSDRGESDRQNRLGM